MPMKDMDGLIIFIFGIIVAAAICIGFMTMLKKSVNTAPPHSVFDEEKLQGQQRRMMDDRQQQEKDFRRETQQKIHDYRQHR